MSSLRKLGVLSLVWLVAVVGGVKADVVVDGAVLPSSEIDSISIDPFNGDIFIDTFAGDWDIVEGGGGGGTPPPDPGTTPSVNLQVNFSSSATVDVGATVQMRWTVSDATSCETLNGNAGWQATNIPLSGGSASGSRNLTVDFSGTRAFTLRCVNGSNSRSDSVNVTGRAPDPEPADCPDASAPTTRIVDWTDLVWAPGIFNQVWPAPSGLRSTIEICQHETIAVKFNTSTADAVGAVYGSLQVAEPLSGTSKDFAISQDPGSFDVPKACVKLDVGASGSLTWILGGFSNCVLNESTDYYFNLRVPLGCSSGEECLINITSYYYD